MKIVFLWMVMVLSTFGFCAAQADVSSTCYWTINSVSLGNERREFSVTVPDLIKLKLVAVGEVMGVSAPQQVQSPVRWADVKCPPDRYPQLEHFYSMAPGSAAQLESGYKDVYKTGITGVGVRFRSNYYSTEYTVPGVFRISNGVAMVNAPMYKLTYEFVRTALDVRAGAVNLNFIFRYQLNDWHAANISGNGTVHLETDSYFAGCAGVRKDIQVPMRDVWVGELQNNPRTEAFNLDVRCIGLPAGSKLPVKAYFEGDSPGAGRLNLSDGGATGVEILLRVGLAGIPLPFSQGQAIHMTWQRSDVEGEVYTLPITARYAKKTGSQVVPGRADAVLNYIIEYN